MATTIAISRIRLDGGTQLREALYDNATLTEYCEAMEAGAEFPPIHIIEDGDNLWLVDGFHRVAAAHKLGRKTIDAHVRPGTLEEAQWKACAANRGLARSNADKRASVLAALKHPRSRDLGDRGIAIHCGVSHMFVFNLRKELAPKPEVYTVYTPGASDEGRPASAGKVLTANTSTDAPKAKGLKKPSPERIQPAAPEPDEDDNLDDMDAALGFDDADEPAFAPAPATTPKPAVLCDHQGREVPRCLAQKWALLTRQYEATIATIVAAKNAAGQHRAALTRASKSITDGALVRHADLDGWSLGSALKQAELALERLRPWVVCPECSGTGGELGAWCNYCGAAGWLCPADFERRVDAIKAKTKGRGAR
jgi:hypothetical protein